MTGREENIQNMFGECTSLVNATPIVDMPFDSWGPLTNAIYAFNGCSKLQNLPPMNTARIENMAECFTGCSELMSLDNLYTNGIKFSIGLSGCSKLTSFVLTGSNFDNGNANHKIDVSYTGLDATALNALFTSLPTAPVVPRTYNYDIIITGSVGTSTCDRTIATSKNWNVIG